MHIAAVNTFPRAAATAELEFLKRFAVAASREGHEVCEVVTSDDILDYQPDFVLVTHELTAKVTPYFTVGALWSPPVFFMNDPRRRRAVQSYDGYLVGAAACHRVLDDLEFAGGTRKPRSSFEFVPTALETSFPTQPLAEPLSLCYLGVHWDGARHAPLLRLLEARHLLNAYGPPRGWTSYTHSYRGPLPFDGQAVHHTLVRHGIALCIHKDEHRAADTPSMRLFEAAAAGCLMIVDEIPFARRLFGDSAFYIDLRDVPEANAGKIAEVVRWAHANPQAAEAMRRQSHERMTRQYGLQKLVRQTCDFVTQAKQAAAEADAQIRSFFGPLTQAQPSGDAAPLIDVIMRTGERDLRFLRRALASLQAQTEGTYRVLLVDYKGRPEVRALAQTMHTERVRIHYLTSPDTGARSTSLWTGLNQVSAPFFANLDDDDTVAPDHFAGLLAAAREHPDHDLYYSGLVRVEEGGGNYVTAPNLGGPLAIPVRERRELLFLEPFSLSRLATVDNFVGSHAYIARSAVLDERTLQDPRLVVSEDVYLLLMIARSRPFRCSGRPTAYWHWRSSEQDNSMYGVSAATWRQEMARVAQRLEAERFPNSVTFSSLRKFAAAGESNGWPLPAREQQLKFDTDQPLSAGFGFSSGQRTFHAPEANGLWSATTDATLTIPLAEAVSAARIRLSFLITGNNAQTVRITVNDQPFFDQRVAPGRNNTVERHMWLSQTDVLFIRVCCEHTVNPQRDGKSMDGRELGVFLSTLRCSPVSSTPETTA